MARLSVRVVTASLALALASTACGPPASPSPSVVPDPSQQAANTACSGSIDLRSPRGETIDLTGVWRADDLGLYDIQQEGSCLFWFGSSQYPGSYPGEWWAQAFVGAVHNDFTISGQWGDVPFGEKTDAPHFDLGDGEMLLRIKFEDDGTTEQTYLVTERATGGAGGTRWVLESSMPEVTETVGIFGGDESGCAWVEANGTRYEINPELFGFEYRWPPVSIQDYTGHILFRPGDPIRVLGQVQKLLGSGCQPSFILVSEISAPS